jgi:hypothetical protein
MIHGSNHALTTLKALRLQAVKCPPVLKQVEESQRLMPPEGFRVYPMLRRPLLRSARNSTYRRPRPHNSTMIADVASLCRNYKGKEGMKEVKQSHDQTPKAE